MKDKCKCALVGTTYRKGDEHTYCQQCDGVLDKTYDPYAVQFETEQGIVMDEKFLEDFTVTEESVSHVQEVLDSEYSDTWGTCPNCKANFMKKDKHHINTDSMEVLSRSSWWVFYFKCKECDTMYMWNYGDKMGGQSDCLQSASQYNLDEDMKTWPKEMTIQDENND